MNADRKDLRPVESAGAGVSGQPGVLDEQWLREQAEISAEFARLGHAVNVSEAEAMQLQDFVDSAADVRVPDPFVTLAFALFSVAMLPPSLMLNEYCLRAVHFLNAGRGPDPANLARRREFWSRFLADHHAGRVTFSSGVE